jgi:hypothetical protein
MGRTHATAAVIAVAIAVVLVTITGAIGGTSSSGRASGPFAWLHSASLPIGWKVARIHSGAEFGYPPGRRAIKTDPGTASVALLGSGGQIDGFLNATPKQAETLSNWRRFRPQHNRREEDRNVRVLAATDDARFRSARASCVIDDYRTSKAHYRRSPDSYQAQTRVPWSSPRPRAGSVPRGRPRSSEPFSTFTM